MNKLEQISADENETVNCYAVIYSNYKDGRNVLVYRREAEAKAAVEAELRSAIASLKRQGYIPTLFRDRANHTELYVMDAGIWYEWQIVKTTIK